MFSMSFRRTVVLITVSLCCVFGLIVGCSDTNQKSCSKDKDCSRLERCDDSVCKARSTCRSSDDCLARESCINRRCMPKSSSNNNNNNNNGCEKDADCAPKFCNTSSGLCVDCGQDSDCAAGERCVSGACSSGIPDSGTTDSGGGNDGVAGDAGKCTSDADCTGKANQYCDLLEGVCKERGGQACKKDIDCRGDLRCENDKCERGRRSCTNDPKNCQDDYECRAGLCYPKVCVSEKDCQRGQKCDLTFGRCGGAVQGCKSDAECQGGQKCNTLSGKCEAPPGCQSDSDCQANEECNKTTGQCQVKSTPGCKSDSDCQGGKKCDTSTGQCKAVSTTCSSDANCVPPTGTCRSGSCQSCATQFNCSASTKCDLSTGRCIAPPCTSNGDCSAPNGTCDAGKCKSCTQLTCPTGQKCNATTGVCALPTCVTNRDCSAKEYCRARRCVPKQCDPVAGPKCPNNQSCVNFQCQSIVGKFCLSNITCGGASSAYWCKGVRCALKQCGYPGKTCRSGQTCQSYECKSPPPRRTCTSNTSCRGADTCLNTSTGGHCYRPCTNIGGKCSTGEDCVAVPLANGTTKGFCFRPATAAVGATCDSTDRRCAVGGSCRYNRPTDKTGRCFKNCTVATGSGCTSTQECYEFTKGKGMCLPKGTAKTGGNCRWASTRCDDKNVCIWGNETDLYGKCYARCAAPGGQSTCTTGQSCEALRSTSRYGLCAPTPSRNAGQSCGGFTRRCKANLTCTRISSSSTSAICLKQCKGASDCRSGTGNSRYTRCVPLRNGGGVCYLR